MAALALRPLVDPVVLSADPQRADLFSLARLLLVLRQPLAGHLLARLDPGRLVALGLVLTTSAARGCSKTGDDWQLCASDIDVTAPLLTATRALCESILAAMKAALHRIVHTACTDDDLLPSLSRGFTRSLFVLFGSTSATLALASKLGITGRDPLSFLTGAETVLLGCLSHYCDMQERLASERRVWQACAMYNLSAAVADLLPTLERLLSSLRARIVSSDNRRAYVECAAAFNAAAVRVAKSHVSVYIAPLREEAAAFLRDASPSAPDAPPPLSEVLQEALTELSSAFSRDLYSNLLQPVYLSEIGAALDSLVIDSATGRPRLTIAHQRRMQILTDAVRAAFRQRDVSEETVEAAVSRQTAFLTLIDKSDADLLRIREQLTDRALFALVRALLEGRSSTLVPDLAVISAPTGFRHALAVGTDNEAASIPALLDPTQPSPALTTPFATPPASSTALFSVPLAVAVVRSRNATAPPPRAPGRASLTLLSAVPSVVVECVALLTPALGSGAQRLTAEQLTPDGSLTSAVASLQQLWDEGSLTDLAMRAAEWRVLYALLCRFFHCLPEPLLPASRYEACMSMLRLRVQMSDEPSDAEKWAALFTRHLSLLPEENRATLLYLLRFLRQVAARSAFGKEAALHLVARTFAGAVLRAPVVSGAHHPQLAKAQSERVVQFTALLIESANL